MSTNVLMEKDTNVELSAPANLNGKPDVKSMDYHRQVLQSRLEQEKGNQTYVSPSDNIMSPCTAKLSGLRGKQLGRVKGKSLFAKTTGKNYEAANMFADKPTEANKDVDMQ